MHHRWPVRFRLPRFRAELASASSRILKLTETSRRRNRASKAEGHRREQVADRAIGCIILRRHLKHPVLCGVLHHRLHADVCHLCATVSMMDHHKKQEQLCTTTSETRFLAASSARAFTHMPATAGDLQGTSNMRRGKRHRQTFRQSSQFASLPVQPCWATRKSFSQTNYQSDQFASPAIRDTFRARKHACFLCEPVPERRHCHTIPAEGCEWCSEPAAAGRNRATPWAAARKCPAPPWGKDAEIPGK